MKCPECNEEINTWKPENPSPNTSELQCYTESCNLLFIVHREYDETMVSYMFGGAVVLNGLLFCGRKNRR